MASGDTQLAVACDADVLGSQDREAQLREAQRIAKIGSWEWMVGSEEIAWSEGLYLILGREPSSGPPSFANLSQAYAPESWRQLSLAIADCIDQATPYELELAMVRADGGFCWTTTRGEAVCAADGSVLSLRGTVHDITLRKQAEQAHQDREAQLREAQRIAKIGSWEWMVDSNEVAWSEGLHLILERPPMSEPPTFETLPEFYAPESWQRLRAAIARILEDHAPYELELAMLRDDGEICWTTTRGEAVLSPSGAVTKLRGTVHDITERKRLQASTAQADRLSSMGLLAAGVAHEINNPLTYVLYNVESLVEYLPKVFELAQTCATTLRTSLGEAEFDALMGEHAALLRPAALDDAMARLGEAVEGSQRIKVLIRSLGTFSRVERVEQSGVALEHAIESAINMARNEMRFRARLIKDLRAVPTVWASEGKLSQVFLNLLINAAHAIEEGHVEDNAISIRTWSEGDVVVAEVADTGIGIPEEHLERIFEPFFSTKQIGRGSGLGLAICRNLVSSFGGEIEVQSEVGKGSRFTVRLPIRQEVVEQTEPGVVKHPPSRTGRILIVDDELALRRMLEHLLGDRHEVVGASSGLAGKAILERDQSFDVILCDLMMPEMTGMELHRWLVENHPTLATRVVFITGGIFTPRAQEYLSSVSNLQVQKPFSVDELDALIGRLVDASIGA